MWWKITVVVGHSVRAPTLRRDFTCWCWRAASLLAVSVCPGTPAATPPGSCRTTGRISHTEASDLPPSLRGHDQGNGAAPRVRGGSVSKSRIKRGYGLAPLARGGGGGRPRRSDGPGVSPVGAGRSFVNCGFTSNCADFRPTSPHCFWARENTPARSGGGEGPAKHGWPGRGEAPNFASGNGAFNIGGQENPRKRVAPPGLWPMGWGRLITTVCSPQGAGRGSTTH